MDMSYRAIINMLMMCGCIGKPGGGWSHYVGQEKLRPQTGWTALAFALDWTRPPRHMNATSFFYAHTDQWRYDGPEHAAVAARRQDAVPRLADRLQRARGAHGLAAVRAAAGGESAQGRRELGDAAHAGAELARQLRNGTLQMACEDPDAPENFPRNLFVWRSNLLGSSGKGHEYFLKHLLGTTNGVQGEDLGATGGARPEK
jgi:nitrate reductase alpha subunit